MRTFVWLRTQFQHRRRPGTQPTEAPTPFPEPVRVYSLAKTVADCFKFRGKIGQQVALDALWEGWRQSRFSKEELQRWAGVCRVTNVMRPYVESLA